MKKCKKCGRRIPNDKNSCIYCHKPKNNPVTRAGKSIGAVFTALGDAFSKSAAARRADFNRCADMFRESKDK
jgi:uncharacterized OB-fold protein